MGDKVAIVGWIVGEIDGEEVVDVVGGGGVLGVPQIYE